VNPASGSVLAAPSPDTAAASEAQRAWGLLRLICGHICLHASMAGMRLATPLLALQLGHNPVHVGFLLALYSLSQVFLALPAGRFADRHGLRRPMGLGVVVAMAGALLSLVFPVFPVLCLSALCMGAATGGASIALQRHVGRAARDNTELKRVFSWLAIGPAVSNFFGPVSAGLLIDYAGAAWSGAVPLAGFRAAFLFMALLPILGWYFIRATPELGPATGTSAAASSASAWSLLQEPAMRRLLLVNWALSSCWDVHTFVVPILGHERAFSASVIGTILGGFAIAAAAVRVAMPLVAAHLKEWVVLTCAMLLTAGLFAVYPFMQSPWTMGLCSACLGLSLGSVQPMIMSTLHQITPQSQHGQALGLRLMTINFSSVVMPLLFGTAGAVVGVSVVFWTVGTLVAWGSHLAWRLRP